LRLEVSGIRTPSSTLSLEGKEDEILLTGQGVYQPEGRPVWQIGELRLTSKQLLFLQPRGIIFNTPLALITGVSAEHKRFTVVRKMAMAISYRDPRRKDLAKAWFITLSLGRWLAQLRQMVLGSESGPGVEEHGRPGDQEIRRSGEGLTLSPLHPVSPSPPHPLTPAPLPPITHAQMERLAMELDPLSRELLWHLWLNKHATIGELAELIAAPTHMDILFRIRQGINPVAEEVLGWSILVFEESRFDQETGEAVSFSWWLAGEVAPATAWREPEVEVFNEAQEINVVVELPGVEEQTIRVSARREKVVVWVEDADPSTRSPSAMLRASRTGVNCRVEVPLPAPVDGERVVTHFNNGILIVNLQKACAEPCPEPCPERSRRGS